MGRSERGERDSGWLISLFGALMLIAPGFLLGLVVGIAWEEPELIAGHFAGRSEEVSWLPNEAEARLGPIASEGSEQPDPLPAVSGNSPRRGTPIGGGGAAPPEPESGEPFVAHEIAIELPSVGVAPKPGPALPPVAALPSVATGPTARSIDSLPAVASPAPSGPSFAVQVGAFAEDSAAEEVRDDLRRKGFDVYVISTSRSGDGRARVRVGPVPSKPEAQALADRLKSEERLPTWVLTESGS